MTTTFDKLWEETSAPSGGSSTFDQLWEETAPKKAEEKLSDIAPYGARAMRAGVLGTPRALTGLLKTGGEFLRKKGVEQAEKAGREISPEESKFSDYVVKALGYPEELLTKLGAPTYQEFLEWQEQQEGVPTGQEKSSIQKGAESVGSFLGGAALTPMGAFGTAGRLATTGLAAGGIGAAAALGGEGGAQLAAGIGLPAIVKTLQLIKTGKIIPTGAQAKQLYDQGKRLGLSDAELTPLIQSDMKQRYIGAVAKGTPYTEGAIEASKGALGMVYEDIKADARLLPPSTLRQSHSMATAARKIVGELRESQLPTADKKAAIEMIEGLGSKIAIEGITPIEAIATLQDINQTVNWNSIKNGKKMLAEVKKPLTDFLRQADPELATRLETSNKLWGRLKGTSKKLEGTKYDDLLKLGKRGALVGGIIHLFASGNPTTLAGVLAANAIPKLAGRALTDPRLNSTINRLMLSTKDASRSNVMHAVRTFEKEMREFPEIHDEFDWESILEDSQQSE